MRNKAAVLIMGLAIITATAPTDVMAESIKPVIQPHEVTYLGDWTITFYCNCSECSGQWAGGLTASGTEPTEGRTVACGSLDFGTEIYIEGLGDYVVEDRGVEGNWIDVYLDSHEACNQMGMMSRTVYLTE